MISTKDQACETPTEDLIICLIEHLRKPDARLSVEGRTWSACFGRGDVLNGMIADRLASTFPPKTAWDAHHNRSYELVESRAAAIYDTFECTHTAKPAWVRGGNSIMQDEARIVARRELREAGHHPAVPEYDRGA